MMAAKREAKYDYVVAIIEWESGELDQEGTIKLFQYLVDTGLCWQLQGCYGRAAQSLIDAGLVVPKGKTHGAEGGKKARHGGGARDEGGSEDGAA